MCAFSLFMSLGILAQSGAAAAAQTANVLAPPTRGRAAPLGFAFGMVPSEQSKAAGILEQALVDELGTDYRRRITDAFVPRPEVPLTRGQIVMPPGRLFRAYRSARNLDYGDAGRRNQLDVWKRADLPNDAKAPVLVQFHGGGCSVASKEHSASR